VLAASETHNRKNINAGTDEALSRYVEVAARARADFVPFRSYVSCAFGCPYEGDVKASAVVDLTHRLLAIGAYEVSIGDTIGVGHPKQTRDLLAALAGSVSLGSIALHLHDTRGMALANVAVALDVGVRSFDSSAGGLGGCPYAPGAAGNVATEDLVCMLHGMGIATGIDLDKLCAASLRIERLLGRRLPSKVLATRRGPC
jgi:hydroxymethylglutaryl-CoA lyase